MPSRKVQFTHECLWSMVYKREGYTGILRPLQNDLMKNFSSPRFSCFFLNKWRETLHVPSNWHPFFVDLSHVKLPTTYFSVLPDHFCKSKPIFFCAGPCWLACLCLYDNINVCIFQNVKFISASTNINE